MLPLETFKGMPTKKRPSKILEQGTANAEARPTCRAARESVDSHTELHHAFPCCPRPGLQAQPCFNLIADNDLEKKL